MQKLYKNKLLLSVALFSLTLAAVFTLNSAQALAATRTWDGGGSDNNFSTATNWDTDTAPVNGDVIVFPATAVLAADRDLTNDITGLSVAGIQFTGTYADSTYYTIAGNALTVTGDITGGSSGAPSINLAITLGADVSITNLSKIVSPTGSLAIGNHHLTLGGADSGFIDGTVSGSGAITASHWVGIKGTANMNGFTGTITQTAGYLSLDLCTTLNWAESITINDNAHLQVSCSVSATILPSIILQGDGEAPTVQQAPYATTYYSPSLTVVDHSTSIAINIASISLQADATYNSYVNAETTVTVQAIAKSGHSLVRVPGSSGKLIIEGTQVTSTYNTVTDSYESADPYDVSVPDKLLYLVNGNQPGSDYTVFSGGILGGTGSVGTIDIASGGTLAPGMSPGCLNSGNVTFVEGGIYEEQLGGTTVCTQYDQQRVTGTVTLGNATLNTFMWNGYKPAAGTSYTIISNDGSDAVAGTFKNLAEGATFTQDGYVIRVSYVGGDGNDVVLTVVSVPKTPNTGFAPLTNNPVTTLFVTTGAAVAIALIARQRKTFAKHTSRR